MNASPYTLGKFDGNFKILSWTWVWKRSGLPWTRSYWAWNFRNNCLWIKFLRRSVWKEERLLKGQNYFFFGFSLFWVMKKQYFLNWMVLSPLVLGKKKTWASITEIKILSPIKSKEHGCTCEVLPYALEYQSI